MLKKTLTYNLTVNCPRLYLHLYHTHTHAHTTNQDRGNIDQVQNINMTLFHNPKKRSDFHIRKAKFSLFSSLNWIYFEQRTVIQFQNKQDHLCLNTINSTVKTKWFTFIFTHFLLIKVFFQIFQCWC